MTMTTLGATPVTPVTRRARAVRGRARGRWWTTATRASAETEGGEEGSSKRWKPKPLPSAFGDADKSARTRSPFGETASGATSGSAGGGAAAASTVTPASPFGDAASAKPASPFGAEAAKPAAKPASPFGASVTPAAGGNTPAQSPFGAAEARSPFAAAPGSNAAKSPFGGASSAKNPFNEPEAALYGAASAKKRASKPVVEEQKKSLLESLPRPTLGQVVIVLSFTTIISLMLGTFWVVVNAGGVHFNDA